MIKFHILSVFVTQIHTHEDQYRTYQEKEGDGLREEKPSKEDGGDGIEIDIVRHDYRP
jgi:hypothetical protein